MIFHQAHGGQLRRVADHFGIPVGQLLDFSANINPEGPPAEVAFRLRAVLEQTSMLSDYPDLQEIELRQSLAGYAGVDAKNIVVANGFVPLLDAALSVLGTQRCLVPVPAFVEYRKSLERLGSEMIPHLLLPDSDFSLGEVDFSNVLCDAILLANPQNPSGVLADREALLRVVDNAAKRNIYFFLDEAFIDYCPDASLASQIDRFPNLIVFRSVTKFFDMAGLRIAYAVTNEDLSRKIQDSIAPWPISSLASLAAGIAVREEAYIDLTLRLNQERRRQLRTKIEAMGLIVYPSTANFLLLRLPHSIDSRHFWENMICKHKVVLRNCANYDGLDDHYLRAAVRRNAENDRLAQALHHEVAAAQ